MLRPLLTTALLLLCAASAYATPPAPLPPAEDGRAALALDAPAPALVCEDAQRFWSGSCAVELGLELTAREAIKPLSAQLFELSAPDTLTIYEYEQPQLKAGQTWRPKAPRLLREGSWAFVLTYEDAAGARHQLGVMAKVRNPARDAAVEACGACSGEFKRWGMQGREWCNCATKDAGKACQDERDCESACLAVKLKTPDDAPGQCAARKALFGCYTYIKHDASHPAGRRRTTICAD